MTSPPEVVIQATDSAFSINWLLVTMSATPDGRFLVTTVAGRGGTQNDLWLLPLQPGDKAVPLLQQEFNQTNGQVSPDGRWLAYVSNESGADDVFLRPLAADPVTGIPTPGGAIVVSRGGGTAPRWRRDGRELFYLSAGGGVMATPVTITGAGAPIELFRADGALSEWGVAQDGQRFLLALPVRQNTAAPFTVVLNWRSALTP